MATKWWGYVLDVIGSDSFTDAANKAGFDKSAFTRWKKGANADPAFAVALARGYGKNVIEALVASGLITDAEANLRIVVSDAAEALSEATDKQILTELLRRVDGDGSLAHPELTTDIDVPLSPSGGVFEVYDGNSQPPERRAAKKLDVGAEQGTPDDLGEDSQIPLEDWDE